VRPQIAFDNMQVRTAHATHFDPNQNLAFSRLGDRQINQFQRRRFHGRVLSHYHRSHKGSLGYKMWQSTVNAFSENAIT
jgi:hypothetical protein